MYRIRTPTAPYPSLSVPTGKLRVVRTELTDGLFDWKVQQQWAMESSSTGGWTKFIWRDIHVVEVDQKTFDLEEGP